MSFPFHISKKPIEAGENRKEFLEIEFQESVGWKGNHNSNFRNTQWNPQYLMKPVVIL